MACDTSIASLRESKRIAEAKNQEVLEVMLTHKHSAHTQTHKQRIAPTSKLQQSALVFMHKKLTENMPCVPCTFCVST